MHAPDYTSLTHNTRALSVALGYRDRMTQLHSKRVLGLSQQLGHRIDLDARALECLAVAATFHDIGKIGVPDQILLKPGRLDADELSVMQQHSATGEKIIAATGIPGCRDVATIIRHHHEHIDGSGYPDGLAGEAIPIAARIISITDSYDAMAVTRSYHAARSHGEIMVILEEERGIKHDPWLLDSFAQLIETSEYRTQTE